jgi:hypothetical protein
MLMTRYKLKYKIGNQLSFNIPLSMGNIDLVDLKESIDAELNGEKEKSINPVVNGDVVRFRPSRSSTQLTFLFNGLSNYTAAGFVNSEISPRSDVFTNSNYIFQVYDTYESERQVLLHTGYLNGYSIPQVSSIHTLPLTMECFSVYVPQSYLDSFTRSTFTLYLKAIFYRAKDGVLIPFTQNVSVLNDESQLYFSFVFNKTTKTYDFPSTITFKQLPSSQYTDIVNQTVESVRLEKPTYPEGNTFTVDGDYSSIE